MKRTRGFLIGCLLGLIAVERVARAHEDHAALPSTGVVLDGNRLLVSANAIKSIGLQTATIRLGDVQHTLQVNARVELPWSGQAKITTLTAGKVERVLVTSGVRVAAGQELASVAGLELDSLQAELLVAAAKIDLLERLVKTRLDLTARGTIEGKLLFESKAELIQERAEREIAFRKLRALGLSHESLVKVLETGETIRSIPIVAPIDGAIRHAHARPGRLVESTDHLFDMVDLSTLYVVGDVLESDAFLVARGLTVEITFSGLPGQRFPATVDHVRMKMNEAMRSVQAVVKIDNRQGMLRPGMFGRMVIKVSAASQQIVCPMSALIETDGGDFVLKRDSQGKFSRRPVKLGMRSPHVVVVKSGLFPGQRVITRGAHLLAAMYDGATPNQKAGAEKSDASRRPTAAGEFDRLLAAKATVEVPANQKAFATSLMEGRVARILVSPGQHVQAGQVLAEVESQAIRNLQLELLQSAAALRWAESEVARLRPLAESGGGTSVRTMQQRMLDVKTRTYRVSSLQRRLTLIGLASEEIERLRRGVWTSSDDGVTGRLAIRSPIRGRIADSGLVLGEKVHDHDSLFEIQETASLWIRALVLEKDAARIQTNRGAVVTFPSNPSLRLTGTVVRIAPQLASRERVLPVWIEVPNSDGFLKDGMLARVEIHVPKHAEAVAERSADAK